ncbi:hypothetical protein QQ045_023069 [Rhodiola kirilowii]
MRRAAGLVVALILTINLSNSTWSSPNTNITQVLCNSGTYSPGNPFNISLTYVINELVEATPDHETRDFYNISPYPNAVAYGHGSCSPSVTSSDCWTCLVAARMDMLRTCPSRIGARAVLADCGMRYEQYPFA